MTPLAAVVQHPTAVDRERPMTARCFEVATQTKHAHHLLLAIASHWSKDDPLCRAGTKRLRTACGLPSSTFYRALSELVEIGAVEVVRRVDSFGFDIPSFYRMTPENAPTLRVELADRDDRQLSLPPVEVEPVTRQGVPPRDRVSHPGTGCPTLGQGVPPWDTIGERSENALRTERARLATLASRASRAEPSDSGSESARPAERLATDGQRALLDILSERLDAPLTVWARRADLTAGQADDIIRTAKPSRTAAEAGQHVHRPADWALVRSAGGAPHSGLLRCGCGAFVQGLADDGGVSVDLFPGVAWRLGAPDRVRLTIADDGDPLRFDVLPAGLVDVDPMVADVYDCGWHGDGAGIDDDCFAVVLTWGALPKSTTKQRPAPRPAAETPAPAPLRPAAGPPDYWRQFDEARDADDLTAASAVATLAERSGDQHSATCMRESITALRAAAGGPS